NYLIAPPLFFCCSTASFLLLFRFFFAAPVGTHRPASVSPNYRCTGMGAGDAMVKKLFGLLKMTFQEWKEDKASRLAAALSYYTIFSLAPLLLVAITIIGFVVDPADIQGELYGRIED